MFGTAYHPMPSILAQFDHLKGQLSLLIFHKFLSVFNPKSHLRVCCLYIDIMFVCVRVCVWAAVSAGLSLAVRPCLFIS